MFSYTDFVEGKCDNVPSPSLVHVREIVKPVRGDGEAVDVWNFPNHAAGLQMAKMFMYHLLHTFHEIEQVHWIRNGRSASVRVYAPRKVKGKERVTG